MRRRIMFFFVSVLLTFYIPLGQMFDYQITDVDVYGKMLVANENIVISIINRTYPTVAIYRPYRSTDFCALNMSFLPLDGTYIMVLAISRDGATTPNRLFFQGVTIYNGVAFYSLWGVLDFSMSPCGWVGFSYYSVWPISDYPLLGVSTSGNKYLYADNDFSFTYDFGSGNSSFMNGRSWPHDPNFIPYAIDIAYGEWGVIAGTLPNNHGVYVPTLYLITFLSSVIAGNYNYACISQWQASFVYSWQSQMAQSVSGSSDFNTIYGLSLSINDQGDILFGVQSMNTVFHLYVNPTNPTSFIFKGSKIYSVTIPSIGFGKNVGWLDNTTAVILANNVSLDYATWYSSEIQIYDLSNGQLSNTQQPYSSFPSTQQSMYSLLSGTILLMTASYTGSIIFMDSLGQVYIILPPLPGHYTVTSVGNTLGTGVYFSSSAACPEGTSTNVFAGGKYLFDTCKPCPEGTFRPFSTNLTAGCVPCNTTIYFCPLGAVAEVPLSYIYTISQAVAFPKSPELTGFEDILLLNMFSTNFKPSCLLTTPFFWTLIMIGIAMVILVTMGILQWTGKCENFRTKLQSVFRHFDIINDGERWVGGVLSFSIFVIIIFAALFTNSFVQQYPQEQSHTPDFTCDETLRNSQFSSQMQALGAAVPDDAKEIFTLLKSQKFFLIVTLLNTITNTIITVEQTVGTITTKLQIDVSVPNDGCLLISCNLTANIATVNINISSSQAIGGVRISLSAPSIVYQNNKAKELLFADSFTISNRTMSQEPYFNVELVQVINETRPLSVNDVSQYSGLWIPIFIKDDDRNFYTESDFTTYHTNYYTILTIDITEAAYYIYNLEKPIVKTTKAIFKNILFATTCLEIFGFAFLIFKLAIIPLVRLIISRVSSKGEESKKKNGENKDDNNEDDDESEKEEDKEKHESDDDDDDDDEIEKKKKKLKPGKNEWYMPNVKI